MRKELLVISLAAVAAALAGCASIRYAPLAMAPTSLGPHEKVIGIASGEGESLQDAIKKAIGDTGADTMINVFIDEQLSCTMGWSSEICVPTGRCRIFGTLIRYEDLTHQSSKSIDVDKQF